MAGELKHAPALPVPTQLTQAEWESTDIHTIESGQPGDLLMFDGTEIVRFPKGADGTIVGVVSGSLTYITPSVIPPTITLIDSGDSPYSVLATEDVILVNTSGGSVILVMPLVASATKTIRIKKITSDANTVTITPSGINAIEGGVSFVLPGNSRSAVVMVPDVANSTWWVT